MKDHFDQLRVLIQKARDSKSASATVAVGRGEISVEINGGIPFIEYVNYRGNVIPVSTHLAVELLEGGE